MQHSVVNVLVVFICAKLQSCNDTIIWSSFSTVATAVFGQDGVSPLIQPHSPVVVNVFYSKASTLHSFLKHCKIPKLHT